MFAHNNPEIDYLRLAVTNAYLIQHNLGLSKDEICIITDSESYEFVKAEKGEHFLKTACGHYKITTTDPEFTAANQRNYKDTNHNMQLLPFYNCNRCDVYDLSPFDETIVIDADYLVLTDSLNACWDHNNDLMMNWEYNDVMSTRKYPTLERINPLGIKMYWATVVYFRRSEYNEAFFNLIQHVRDNKEYYQVLYQYPGNIYRNDYSFSIASHIMSGLIDEGVNQLPITLYKSFDVDDVHHAVSPSEIVLLLEDMSREGESFILTRWKNDIHIMNKWAIGRINETFLEKLGV